MPTTNLGIKVGSEEIDYSVEFKNRVSHRRKTGRRTWIILGESLNDTTEQVLATPGVPALWSQHEDMYVTGATPREVDRCIHPTTHVPTILWEVDISYDSDVIPQDDTSPTAKPPRIRWTSETIDEVMERDVVTGQPCVTRAGERIDITAPVLIPILEIQRYEVYPFNPTTILQFGNRVNNTPFWGAPAGTALMAPMEADEEIIERDRYAVVTYRIKFHTSPTQDPWRARVLHQGALFRPQAGRKPEHFRDCKGNPTVTNLADDGTQLADSATPQFLSFNRYQFTNFNSLSLGPFG